MAKGRKPQLSDTEVALIKAMLATDKYKRQDILTYFSRTDRPVNLGRISEIATGKKRTDIAAASQGDLDSFLQQSGNATLVQDSDPIGDAVIDDLLTLKSKRPRILKVEESETVEFKESFNWSGRAKYARTIAGMANHNGGYILFGVKDDGTIIGMRNDTFSTLDQSKITQFLNACFQPQIYWKRTFRKFGAKTVGVLWVQSSKRKPVICSKTVAPLREGEICFRYIGETRAIGYSELITLLDNRDRQTEQLLATKVSRIAEIGSDRAGVLDINTGMVEGRGGSFIIDESLLDKVRFITEGRFDDTGGDPALRIVGNVKSISQGITEVVKTEKTLVTNHDILSDFIHQRQVYDPSGYIRHIVHDQTLIVPIFYYIHQAGLSIADAITLLMDETTTHEAQRTKVIARITGRTGYPAPPGPSTEPYREKILSGKRINFAKAKNRSYAVRALRTIPTSDINSTLCMTILIAALRDYERDQSSKFLNEIRYSATHIDAVVFTKDIPD